LPYGVSLSEDEDVKEGQIASESLQRRLEMMIRDVRVYGEVLGKQRRADLTGKEPGFLGVEEGLRSGAGERDRGQRTGG